MNTTMQDLTTPCTLNFCPGCGDFGIWGAFRAAAVKEGWDSTNTAIVAGVGCHGHMPNFIKITAFTGLHGRAVPIGEGIKMANHDLNVFVFTGDGDSLAEGGNHFIHFFRRNHDVNIILHDNAIYGLTTGQTSPASPHGFVSKSTPGGNLDNPIHPCALAITAGATFVARAYAGDIKGLTEIMIKAQQHKGATLIDILQPCVTWNGKKFGHDFYRENSYQLGDDWDPTNKYKALEVAETWAPKQIALGVIYEDKNQPAYEAQLPQIADGPMAKNPTVKRDVSKLFQSYF